MRLRALYLTWALVLPLTAAAAPQDFDVEAVRASKRVAAVRTAEPIVVDGVLDEAAWSLAEPAVDFHQQFPDEFAPATERSTVRFLYDNEMLYIGAMLSRRRAGPSHHRLAAARLLEFPDRLVSRRAGHVPRSTQRVRVRHQRRRRTARCAGVRQRSAQRRQLGRRLDRPFDRHRERLEHRDGGALQNAPISTGRRAAVGTQHAARHPPQERVRHLVAGASSVFALRGRICGSTNRHIRHPEWKRPARHAIHHRAIREPIYRDGASGTTRPTRAWI